MATWTWQRVNGAGVAVDRGALYRSLPECFATLRANRAEFGIAPVRINLDGAGVREAASVVAVSVGERDVSVSSTAAITGPDPSTSDSRCSSPISIDVRLPSWRTTRPMPFAA